jgi:hypothetical protein
MQSGRPLRDLHPDISPLTGDFAAARDFARVIQVVSPT